MKYAGLFMIAAAVPVAAQSDLSQGHRLGTSVAYLKESGDLPDGTPIGVSLPNSAGPPSQVMVLIRNPDGTGTVRLTPLAPPASRAEPCAAFETWAETRTSNFIDSTRTGVRVMERTEGKAVFSRFVRDEYRQIYASYTVTVETLPEEGTYRVSFGPPVGEAFNQPDWKVYSPEKYPAPQIMKNEDSIRLELYTVGPPGNPYRRVVDYFHAGRQDKMIMRTETPHEYYAADAEFAISQPRVRVNGIPGDAVGIMPEILQGPVLWVYIPRYGRYILSPHAHPGLGFEMAGETDGKSLTFRAADGNIFRIDTAERVATGSGSYTLYVAQDPTWEPADPQDRTRVMVGAGPGLVGMIEEPESR